MLNKAWSGKMGGTQWMQQSLISMFRLFNPVYVYPIMWIWVTVSILTGRAGREGIYYYWHNRLGYSRWASIRHLFLTYIEFGKAILDRFAAWGGRKIKTRIENKELLDYLINQPTGFIFIGSHIGNQELGGYYFVMPKPTYVLAYTGDTETVNKNRATTFERMGLKIIPYLEDGSHIFDMHQAIANGNILSIHGDRMFYGERTLREKIFGEEANFPEGTFKVAAIEKVPIISLFMMREKHDSYILYVRQLSDGHYQTSNHKQQAQEILRSYIQTIEEMMEKYPHQWFQFYHFWEK